MIDLEEEKQSCILRAFLVGLQQQDEDEKVIAGQLDELAELVSNLNMIPLEPEIVKVRSGTHVRYRIGSGKAAEIAQLAQECEADVIVFDSDLTPSQQRNWERLFGGAVIGREEVILDIFADRASTREAVLQVELARLEYSLPRLTRRWTHLSRQRGGGVSNRGQGEAQIETDRRLLRKRIMQLQEELALVRKQRDTQRKSRMRRPVFQGAIVGYTNVGKSSLLRALTGADILVKDQLFATLDPTARKVILGNGLEMVLTDTVGFVRKLPHQLVEAFKSTLEEAVLADMLLLVLDVSGDDIDMELETTLGVLKELGAEEKRIQMIFNKNDLVDPERDAMKLARLHSLYPDAVFISSADGSGLEELRSKLALFAGKSRELFRATLPPHRHDLIALVHSAGQVYEEEYTPDGSCRLVFAIEVKYQHRFREFLQ